MIGQQISRYRIRAKIGEGAMGEVYEAEHVQLHHLVAIKILKAPLVQGEEAQQRFRREAEIAASLDSPGLCNVIDYGEHDGRTYLVMRYCEGPELKQVLLGGPLPVEQAVLLAIQLGEALEVAHGQGIVHRDLKPGNIMVSCGCDEAGAPAAPVDATTLPLDRTPRPGSSSAPRFQARIVDFGLALVADTSRLTATGGLVGTPAYMAPEQVRAGAVDQRADLWALGAILYEMVAGRPAFAGDSPAAVLDGVLHGQPANLSSVCPAVPAKLIWIVAKALRKKPGERYQDAAEMLGDLRNLEADLRAGAAAGRPTWIVENLRWLRWTGVALLAIATMSLGMWAVRPDGDQRDALPTVRPLPLSSGDGWEGEPAISPDGERIAYTSNAEGQYEIYVVSARGGQPLRITDHEAWDRSPAWFPDGDQLAFTSDRQGSVGIWKTHQYGGGATLLLPNASDPAVSPDGTRLAYVQRDVGGEGRIGVASMADLAGACLMTQGQRQGLWSHREPAWSHDGRWICYSAKINLWLLDPATGEVRQLTRDGREDRAPAWSPDDQHVYFQSLRGDVPALWRVRVSDGLVTRVTQGGGADAHPSVAATGHRLAFHAVEARSENLLIFDLATGQESMLGGQHRDSFPSLARDGSQLVFVSDRWGGRSQVWLQELADGRPEGLPTRLTDQPGHASQPALSPDGRWVAYYRYDGEERDLWLIPTVGGRPVRLTTDPGSDVQPAWSPDGRQLAFASNRDTMFAVWLLPVADGQQVGPPTRLTPPGLPAERPLWSPDGGCIAFVCNEDIWLQDLAPGAEPRPLTHDAQAARMRWEATGDSLWVSGRWNGCHNSLRKVPVAGGTARPLLADHPAGVSEQTQYFDLSDDG